MCPSLGADILIGGDLPAEGGLSSSSALTVALGATLSDLAGLGSEPDLMVASSAAAERLTGVAGGEMDQNVIVRGIEGHALRIDFAPFSTRDVPLPEGVAIVTAHSGTAASKGGNARIYTTTAFWGARLLQRCWGPLSDSIFSLHGGCGRWPVCRASARPLSFSPRSSKQTR